MGTLKTRIADFFPTVARVGRRLPRSIGARCCCLNRMKRLRLRFNARARVLPQNGISLKAFCPRTVRPNSACSQWVF